MSFYTTQRDRFVISTDPARLDFDMIHDFLCNTAYWCRGIPRDLVERSAANSLAFGIYEGEKQVGFARVISDLACIAYLGDVFVLPEYRGLGLSKFLMESIHSHPDLQGLRRWILLTADAHELYRQFGWESVARPELYMERVRERPYGG
jgi:GNAT superfamily N-acetyltransferase